MLTRHNTLVASPCFLTPHPPNTTTHNPRKRAQRLVFGWFYFSLTPPQPTTPENECKGLFLGVWPFHGYHHPPRKWAFMLIFGGFDLSLAITTDPEPPKMRAKPHFCHSFSIKYIIRSNKYIENIIYLKCVMIRLVMTGYDWFFTGYGNSVMDANR